MPCCYKDLGKKNDKNCQCVIFCGNFFNWLEIERFAFSFDIHPLLDQSICGNNYHEIMPEAFLTFVSRNFLGPFCTLNTLNKKSVKVRRFWQKIDTMANVSIFCGNFFNCGKKKFKMNRNGKPTVAILEWNLHSQTKFQYWECRWCSVEISYIPYFYNNSCFFLVFWL